jgi:hypothetical protein
MGKMGCIQNSGWKTSREKPFENITEMGFEVWFGFI